ncbi:MAG: hypothetical protein QOI11_598 [Candidatus Eremiobacteraeota bacterium]|jgi:hypothetical protein|nr:hypothetical protein [Candidatus Eremiobacteraeota bacterium]
MRRIVLSLAVAASAALAACSGGGQVLSTGGSGADRIFISTGGQSNIPRVLAGSGIALSALALRGSQNGVVGKNTFTWRAAIVNDVSYTANTLGGTKACAAVTSSTAAAGPFTPYAPDYSIYIAIDPVNEANIIFQPPLTIPVPAGSFLGPLSTTNAYCAIVSATQGATTGSQVVAIVNPSFPQQ